MSCREREPHGSGAASEIRRRLQQRPPYTTSARNRIDEQVIQNENPFRTRRRKTGIELREPGSRPIRSERQEDHGLILLYSIAEKLARQCQIMSLTVELAICIEQRRDLVQIGDCCPPHKNILLYHGG
jgi:hypothetical protein